MSSHDHAPLNQIACCKEVSTRTYFSLWVFVERFLLSSILGAWKSKSIFYVSTALAFWDYCHLCLKGSLVLLDSRTSLHFTSTEGKFKLSGSTEAGGARLAVGGSMHPIKPVAKHVEYLPVSAGHIFWGTTHDQSKRPICALVPR